MTGSTVSQSLLKFMSIESMLSNHVILCLPLLFLSSNIPSISLFQWVGSLHQVAKALELQFQHSNEYLGLISFRNHWFDLLAVQGTLKSLLQHHSLKVSILWCSAFFMVQHSHPYMTIWKTIALTIQILVCNVISLLFNMQSRFVRAFLPRSKHLLVSWL